MLTPKRNKDLDPVGSARLEVVRNVEVNRSAESEQDGKLLAKMAVDLVFLNMGNNLRDILLNLRGRHFAEPYLLTRVSVATERCQGGNMLTVTITAVVASLIFAFMATFCIRCSQRGALKNMTKIESLNQDNRVGRSSTPRSEIVRHQGGYEHSDPETRVTSLSQGTQHNQTPPQDRRERTDKGTENSRFQVGLGQIPDEYERSDP